MATRRTATETATAIEVSPEQLAAHAQFDAIAERYLGDPAVARTKMFGMPVLKVTGHVFVGLHEGRIVFKLPAARVESLLSAGQAERFSPMAGRTMKEWVVIRPDAAADWSELAETARTFVAS